MLYRPNVGMATFLLLSFGLPWTCWFFMHDDLLSLWLYPMFASIAGFAAAFAEGGKSGLRRFSSRVFSVVSAFPYLLAAMMLPLVLGLSYLLAQNVPLHSMPWTPSAILGLSLIAALVTGPIAEEFGWRGYLQYRLLNNLAPFWTALLLGAIWWIWHFVLYRDSVFASPVLALNFLVFLTTWSIFMVFFVERAGGSVWPAVVLHWAANTHPNVLQALLPAVDGSILPGGTRGAVFYLATAGIFVVFNHRFYFVKRLRDQSSSTRTATVHVYTQNH